MLIRPERNSYPTPKLSWQFNKKILFRWIEAIRWSETTLFLNRAITSAIRAASNANWCWLIWATAWSSIDLTWWWAEWTMRNWHCCFYYCIQWNKITIVGSNWIYVALPPIIISTHNCFVAYLCNHRARLNGVCIFPNIISLLHSLKALFCNFFFHFLCLWDLKWFPFKTAL